MKRILFALPILAFLAGCASDNPLAQAPVVTVNPTTGVATSAPPTPTPTKGGPLDFLAVQLGNDLSLDDVATINLATTGSDTLGLTFANDIAQLINAAKTGTGGTSPNLGTLHLLTDQEQIRLQLISLGSSGGQMALIQKAFGDGVALIRDDEARGIQIAQGFRMLVGNLGLTLVGVPAIPITGG